MKNKVVLHKSTRTMWLVSSYDEHDSDNILVVELTDPTNEDLCLNELYEVTEDVLATVDLARELELASDDTCCVYLRWWQDRIQSKIVDIIDGKEVIKHDYLN